MSIRNISALNNPLMIGNGPNRTVFQTDGTRRSEGDATCWKDIIGDVFGRRLADTAGKVDYDWNENALVLQPGGSIANQNDRVQWNQEINHELVVGSNVLFYPHLHWFQEDATQRTVTLEYRLQRVDTAKTVSWTQISLITGLAANAFPYSGGIWNQISSFPDLTIDCGISDTLQFRMARTDSEAGNMLVYFMDLHARIDGDGSNEPFIKN